MTETNFCKLSHKWWVDAAPQGSFTLNKRPRNAKILSAIRNVAIYSGADLSGLEDLLKQMSPRKSKVDPENLAYYNNSYKYKNEKLAATSPGRFIKSLIPSATDVMVEAFTLFWRDNVAFDLADYIFTVGKAESDYENAFRNYRRTSSVSTDYTKSISDSCMRYQFPSLESHPSTVYATEDFELLTVKDRNGKTRARCVVRVKDSEGNPCYYANYIYASDNHSARMILDHINGVEGSAFLANNFRLWNGARLLKKDLGDKYYICPYIDLARCITVDSDYLTCYSEGCIPEGKSWGYNSTSGYVSVIY